MRRPHTGSWLCGAAIAAWPLAVPADCPPQPLDTPPEVLAALDLGAAGDGCAAIPDEIELAMVELGMDSEPIVVELDSLPDPVGDCAELEIDLGLADVAWLLAQLALAEPSLPELTVDLRPCSGLWSFLFDESPLQLAADDQGLLIPYFHPAPEDPLHGASVINQLELARAGGEEADAGSQPAPEPAPAIDAHTPIEEVLP